MRSPNAAGVGHECRPDDFATLGFSTICHYVQNHSELCDGGGYLHWTEYALCSSSSYGTSSVSRCLVLLSSVLFFILLFLHLSITADSFFCKNIAAIVDLHRISQNIAGVTFMAFGNGAPDIFSSIASVISAKRPRADLAISELLGGGMFVTTCVIAVIALSRPFHLMRRPILRDIFFYLLALALLVFVSYSSRTMAWWHPCAFLLLYLVYAAFVIGSNLLRQRMRPLERRRRMRKTINRFSLLVPPKSGVSNKVAPIGANGGQKGGKRKSITTTTTDNGAGGGGGFIMTPQSVNVQHQQQQQTPPPTLTSTRVISVITLPGALIIPTTRLNSQKDEAADEAPAANDFLEAGKFFAKEDLDESSGDEAAEDDGNTHSTSCCTLSPMPSPASSDKGADSGDAISHEAPLGAQWDTELARAARAMCPLDTHRFGHAAWPIRLLLLAKIPSLLLLRLSVPNASKPWSKPIATVHAFMAPLIFCATFQLLKVPLPICPFVVGELALLLSVLLALFILFTTKLQTEPTCYKRCAAYIGFGISIAWIYATASEVMNVVLMFGTISGIPHQILGLTAISWANSIGDLIADLTVARQGMSRMAFSAAIGAPLFNLMVGFGTTFMIAELQGKVVTIDPDPVALVMFVFLALSLLCTLLLLLLQKFFVRRLHGFVLIALYVVFLILAILASQKGSGGGEASAAMPSI